MKNSIKRYIIILFLLLFSYNFGVILAFTVLNIEYKKTIEQVKNIENEYKAVKWNIDKFYIATNKKIFQLFYVNIIFTSISFILFIVNILRKKV